MTRNPVGRLPPMMTVVKIALGLFLTLFFVGGVLTFFGLMLSGPSAVSEGVGLRAAKSEMAKMSSLVYRDDQRDLERPMVPLGKSRLSLNDDETDQKYASIAQSKIDALSSLRSRNFTFIINVIAWRRRASLKRLITSLESARYHGFTTKLHFHLDGEAHELVKEWVEEYVWPHGKTLMNIHTLRNGLESV